jgi:hypothetical protein
MTERQLPAYGIDAQIHPWTFANSHVPIVSNLGAETADRNELIHGIFPGALSPILDECPTYRPLKGRNRAHRLTRPLFSSDESPVPCTNAILNDHQVDNLAAGDTTPGTNTVMPAAARPSEEIRRTHDSMATMTSHPIRAHVNTGTVLSCGMLSVTHRSRGLYYVAYTAPYTVAALSSEWNTWLICANSTGLTRKRRTPWRNTTCVRSSPA